MENMPAQRIAAIDVFRAITMFLMLFVNDIPGIKNIPHWLLHAEISEDMLGFSDTIFPAFLFCMGMSISYAVQNGFGKGKSLFRITSNVFWRTVALVVMGLFTVNYGSIDPEASGITKNAYCVLMVVGFFLVWAVYPKSTQLKKYLFLLMRLSGVALLLYLFLVFEGKNGTSFGPKWWGILGLIGWSYLICTTVYLFTRENLSRNTVVWVVFVALLVLDGATDIISLDFIPGGMTHVVFGFSGVLASLLMQKYANPRESGKFLLILCGLGAFMLICALLSHPHWIISKILATPTWFFYCMAAFFPLFGFVYWLTDVMGKSSWFAIIKPAGTATLTCYVLPYIWYSTYAPVAFQSGGAGLLRSAVFSLVIVGLTGLLVRGGIKLKV